MSSSKKTPEELLEDGTIDQTQYDAYKSWLRNEKKKERERRASYGVTPPEGGAGTAG